MHHSCDIRDGGHENMPNTLSIYCNKQELSENSCEKKSYKSLDNNVHSINNIQKYSLSPLCLYKKWKETL